MRLGVSQTRPPENLLRYVGYPVKESETKRVRAATKMTWLDLDIYATQQQVTIPSDKVEKIQETIAPLVNGPPRQIKQKVLEKLVGVLQYVAKAIHMSKYLFSELYIMASP